MYAGALGDNAVERYALFLTSLALSADPAERRTALQRAREHGLDVPRVAVVTAERTIERALDGLPSSVKGPLPDLAKATLEPPEEAEILLVRSIEWTVVEADTYDTALEQANVILRYLLGAHLLYCLVLCFTVLILSALCQLAEGSMWRVCSLTCSRQNWRLSVRPKSARRNIWIIASSLLLGKRSSA
jgi:Nuclear pore protein 84 / 107